MGTAQGFADVDAERLGHDSREGGGPVLVRGTPVLGILEGVAVMGVPSPPAGTNPFLPESLLNGQQLPGQGQVPLPRPPHPETTPWWAWRMCSEKPHGVWVRVGARGPGGGDTPCGVPLLEAVWEGAEAWSRPWGTPGPAQEDPFREPVLLQTASPSQPWADAPHWHAGALSAQCTASAQRSGFKIVTEKSSFPVSMSYYSGIKAQVKADDKNLLSAKHVCWGMDGDKHCQACSVALRADETSSADPRRAWASPEHLKGGKKQNS